MCSKLADTIVTFDVLGVCFKISTKNLATQPNSMLTKMVNTTIQPINGFFIETCPDIFGYVMRFLIHNIKINPIILAEKLGTTEPEIRKVIDQFQFTGIYINDVNPEYKIPANRTVLSDEVFNKHSSYLYQNEPLLWAARSGELVYLKSLIKNGIDVNYQGKDFSSTALMYAAQNNELGCLKELLASGAKVDIVNNSGKTALHYAVENGHVDILVALIKEGANLNIKMQLH